MTKLTQIYSAPAGKAVWSDDYVISTGGGDNCVFQWKCDPGDGARGMTDTAALASSSSPSPSSPAVGGGGAAAGHALDMEDDGPTGGDEFTAIKVRE